MEFNFNTDYILENERVELRSLTLQDFKNLETFSIYEPDIWKYSLIGADGTENLKKYLETAISARVKEAEYPFIVFDKSSNEYAGSTRFYDMQLKNKTLQLGFTWYGKKFQGTGLNKHCKFLLLEFAFEKINMERVEFRADFQNKRSISAMKSIGCKEEGVLRSNGIRPDGSRRDSIVLSILKDEWMNEIKMDLQKKLH